jgi:hypothetical protein
VERVVLNVLPNAAALPPDISDFGDPPGIVFRPGESSIGESRSASIPQKFFARNRDLERLGL